MTNQPLLKPEAGLTRYEPTPMELIHSLIERAPDGKPDIEAMKGLMELENTLTLRRAEREFAEALATFQAEVGTIAKTRAVSFGGGGGTAYKYAALEDVWRVVSPVLKRVGLSVRYSHDVIDDGKLLTTCYLKRGIYEAATTVPLAIPKGVKVNDAQQWGMALSYGKRYALQSALGLVIEDEDTDARGLGETITPDQEAALLDLIDQSGADRARFLSVYNISSVADLPASKFAEARAKLATKLRQRGAAQ